MILLYATTIFLGAFLLFLVQPMVGRMLLPPLGGAPAVWNTALLFFQAMLLAGYAYVHATTRWLSAKQQTVLHLVLLGLAGLLLPVAMPANAAPPTGHTPIWWLLGLLTLVVGLPFFVVSASSPLLQRWLAASNHRDAADPYFLYAASNCGSLLALVAYPVLVEPALGLADQSRWWTLAYIPFAVLMAVCGIAAWHAHRQPAEAATTTAPLAPLKIGRRIRWLLLAFVPCSLMLSATTFVTSELAPVPLLWVIPLSLYLFSFVLVFAKRRLLPHHWLVRVMPVLIVALIVVLASTTLKAAAATSLVWPVALHFATLFVVALVCHAELANDRPPAPQLTGFYLWISIGGVLGGIFNALLAPLIFPTVIEYPATLLLACLLLPAIKPLTSTLPMRVRDYALPVALGLVTAALFYMLGRVTPGWRPVLMVTAYIAPAVACLFFATRPLRFTLGVAAILIAITLGLRSEIDTLIVARSFFGVHRVEVFPGQPHLHILKHGTTTHGMQSLNPRHRRIPLTYFTKAGPLGQAISALPPQMLQQVGVIGLGAGTVACYGQAGQQWTFYDIDPVVEHIARTPAFFTYLTDCPAAVTVVPGDARLSLRAVPDQHYSFMVLDAYNSDTIPLHLLTREALALYLQKLQPNGVLACHITNRHLDLEPVFAKLAEDAGLAALCQHDVSSFEEFQRSVRMESRWVVMSREPSLLLGLATDPRWRPLRLKPGFRIWTDDYASIFSVFAWQ